MTREITLNAQVTGARHLNNVKDVGNVINGIRNFEDKLARLEPGLGGALNTLHRSIHRQFPWQRRNLLVELSRYMKVFGEGDVDQILKDSLGLGLREFFFMGMAVAGHLVKHPGINSHQDYGHFKITPESTVRFFERISLPIDQLREQTRAAQRYDEKWSDTWNPLVAKPLVALNPNTPNLLHCPMPELVLRRISQGLYYDIFQAKGFDNAFGDTFEAYIGDFSRHVFKAPHFSLIDETPYEVDGNVHHGTDWIVGDSTANIFVECKTKRLRKDAKDSLENPILASQLGILADAIVQLLLNVKEAKEGKSKWENNQLPIHPLVITLENWYLFGGEVVGLLKDALRLRLRESDLPEELADDATAYSVWSSEDYESVAGIIAEVGIQRFFETTNVEKYQNWMIRDVVRDAFPAAKVEEMEFIFANEWRQILPDGAWPELRKD